MSKDVGSKDIDAQVQLLKTIADVTRLRILGLLAEAPRTGRELADALGLSAATVSHHMGKLTEVGIVSAQVDGTRRRYSLALGLLDDVRGEAPAVEPVADEQHAKVVRNFFDGRRLKQIPAKRRARASVLLELLRWFEPGRRYSEAEVNAVLREAHDDVASLRRELVDYRYLARADGAYWVTEQVPQRSANEAQEVPAGEAAWLGALIRSALPSSGAGSST